MKLIKLLLLFLLVNIYSAYSQECNWSKMKSEIVKETLLHNKENGVAIIKFKNNRDITVKLEAEKKQKLMLSKKVAFQVSIINSENNVMPAKVMVFDSSGELLKTIKSNKSKVAYFDFQAKESGLYKFQASYNTKEKGNAMLFLLAK